MPLFRRRGSSWDPPDPRCVFVVGCTTEELPAEEMLTTDSGAAAEISVQAAVGGHERIPPEDLWPFLGLTPDLAARFEHARHDVVISLVTSGESPAAAVLDLTRHADRVAELAAGCVHDPAAQRFFGPGGWRIPDPLAEVDVREHVTVHAVPEETPGATWVHTHGLVKFGRPEFEIHDVGDDMASGTAAALNDLAQYVLTGALVAPGETVGDPSVPLKARVGGREREHWEGTSVLELVDVDEQGEATSGATRGLRAWWPENFAEN